MEENQRQEQGTTRVQSHPNSRDQLISISAFCGMQAKNTTNSTWSIGAWSFQHPRDKSKNEIRQRKAKVLPWPPMYQRATSAPTRRSCKSETRAGIKGVESSDSITAIGLAQVKCIECRGPKNQTNQSGLEDRLFKVPCMICKHRPTAGTRPRQCTCSTATFGRYTHRASSTGIPPQSSSSSGKPNRHSWGQGLHPVHNSEWQTSQKTSQTRLTIKLQWSWTVVEHCLIMDSRWTFPNYANMLCMGIPLAVIRGCSVFLTSHIKPPGLSFDPTWRSCSEYVISRVRDGSVDRNTVRDCSVCELSVRDYRVCARVQWA